MAVRILCRDVSRSVRVCFLPSRSNGSPKPSLWPIRVRRFPEGFDGSLASRSLAYAHGRTGIKAAIIREKGVNGDREMAYSLYLAGFDVKDVHMTDLMSDVEGMVFGRRNHGYDSCIDIETEEHTLYSIEVFRQDLEYNRRIFGKQRFDRILVKFFRLDMIQSGKECAESRCQNYNRQPVRYSFPEGFDGSLASRSLAL